MVDLGRLRGGGFVVIGRAGMDLYADPPGTALEDAGRFDAALGGSAGNIAVGLVKLGCEAALVTCLSDDAVGRWCLAQLEAWGVDCRHLRIVGGEARSSLAVVDTNGDATKGVIYRNGAADFALTAEDVAAVPWRGWSGLVVTGTALAVEPSRAATLAAMELAREAGLPVVIDLDYRAYSWAGDAAEVLARAAALADMVVGNDVEFDVLAPGAGLEAARALAAEGRVAIYKMGAEGAVTLTRAGETRTGIFETRALKPTGAGDSFLAGLLAALAGGRDLAEAVTRGSAAAAITVSRVGCAPAMPTGDDLDRFLQDRRPTDAHPAP